MLESLGLVEEETGGHAGDARVDVGEAAIANSKQINMSEEGQSTDFSRSPPREGWTKAFAVDSERTRGHANKKLMNSYP